MLASGYIVPQTCDVFKGEALTYFFYGRPAFRPNLDAEPSGLAHYFPVCLLFKPDILIDVRRVFPFDSGAFDRGFYTKYLHRNMKLGDFGLEPDMTCPGKVVSLFFGSNAAYLTGKIGATPKLDPSEFEAQSYIALLQAKDGNALDSRGSSIEVQTATNVNIAETVSAIILPSTFADGKTGVALSELGIDILPYKTFERSRPNEYMSGIMDLCLNYYIRLGLISKEGL